MPQLIQGRHLTVEQRQTVLRAFVHRNTVENSRQSYSGKCPLCEQSTQGGRIITGSARNGSLKEWTREDWHAYHVPIQTDTDWLADHAFWFTSDGRRLSANHRYVEPAYTANFV